VAEANLLEGDPSHRRLGQFAAGTVSMVRPWGVYVDLGLEHAGYIDPMFVQDDLYEVGDRVEAYILDFREQSRVYELRPKGKTSLRAQLAGD
jgi:predicted RNA-binding protein with RPS1 domain